MRSRIVIGSAAAIGLYFAGYGALVLAGARTMTQDFYGPDGHIDDCKIYFIYLARPMLDDSLNVVYWPLNKIANYINTKPVPQGSYIYHCIDAAKKESGVQYPASIEMSDSIDENYRYQGFINEDVKRSKWMEFYIDFQGKCTIEKREPN
jgi:hypothetical protein